MRCFSLWFAISIAGVIAAPTIAAPLPVDHVRSTSSYGAALAESGFVASIDDPGVIAAARGFSIDIEGRGRKDFAVGSSRTCPALGTMTGLYDDSLTTAGRVGRLIYSFTPPYGTFTSAFDASLLTLAGGEHVFKARSLHPAHISGDRLSEGGVPIPSTVILMASSLGTVLLASRRRGKRQAIQAI